MSRICQTDVGRCDFIDVLEEAVVIRTPVTVELVDGSRFIDQVVDVVTENGEDYAVFRDHPRASVTELAAVTRAMRRPAWQYRV